MKTQQKLNEYLRFSKKDRIAVLIISSVMLAAFLIPSFLNRAVPGIQADADTAWISALRQLEKPLSKADLNNSDERKTDGKYRYDRVADRYYNAQQVELFSFDPNTLDDDGWKRLGIKEKTVVTIRKYLAKGGRFRQPEDLRKIYGIRSDHAERLIPYIKITDMAMGSAPSLSNDNKPAVRRDFTHQGRPRLLDINIADSLAFESLPGIGPVLASRITRFRQKLGGFYTVSQLKEVFGVSDTLYQKIAPQLFCNNDGKIRKIDIGNATVEELKDHPYIRYKLATTIINYRTQHGFASLEDLKKTGVIDDSLFRKIKPYLLVRIDN